MHTTMVEVNGYMEESSPKDYEEQSIPDPEFILEQLSIHVENKTPVDHVFVCSKSGSVLRTRSSLAAGLTMPLRRSGSSDSMRMNCSTRPRRWQSALART